MSTEKKLAEALRTYLDAQRVETDNDTLHGMIVIRNAGVIVSRSRNLRGIIRYGKRARTSMRIATVTVVHVLEIPGGALLRVRWSDGAYAVARFQSCTVARRWAHSRRAWPCARYTPLHVWHAWRAPTRADA